MIGFKRKRNKLVFSVNLVSGIVCKLASPILVDIPNAIDDGADRIRVADFVLNVWAYNLN